MASLGGGLGVQQVEETEIQTEGEHNAFLTHCFSFLCKWTHR